MHQRNYIVGHGATGRTGIQAGSPWGTHADGRFFWHVTPFLIIVPECLWVLFSVLLIEGI